jgi:hypothetical protein
MCLAWCTYTVYAQVYAVLAAVKHCSVSVQHSNVKKYDSMHTSVVQCSESKRD